MEDKWIFTDKDSGTSFVFDTEQDATSFAKEYHWACLIKYGKGLFEGGWEIMKVPHNPDFKTWWDDKNL